LTIKKSLIPFSMALSLLAGRAADAASFNWSFINADGGPATGGSIAGTINGLSEGTNNFNSLDPLNPGSPAYGISVDLNQAQNAPTGFYDAGVISGSGGFITVSGGAVSDYNFTLFLSGPLPSTTPTTATFSATLNSSASFLFNPANPGGSDTYFGPGTIFSPASNATVPGPLPVLGFSMAFAWSRRLRQRLVAANAKADRLSHESGSWC
jgi:hypothetical protein